MLRVNTVLLYINMYYHVTALYQYLVQNMLVLTVKEDRYIPREIILDSEIFASRLIGGYRLGANSFLKV